jgi:hypothetical protein
LGSESTSVAIMIFASTNKTDNLNTKTMEAHSHQIEVQTLAGVLAENERLREENLQLRHAQNALPLLALLEAPSFKCSSRWDESYDAASSRLNRPECWHPAKGSNYHNQFVEVDLGAEHVVSQIEIHGRGLYGQYVTKFEILYKVTAEEAFTALSPLEGEAMNQFTGVRDQHAMRIISNFRPFHARFVRILPREFHDTPSFKWELHGYKVLNA